MKYNSSIQMTVMAPIDWGIDCTNKMAAGEKSLDELIEEAEVLLERENHGKEEKEIASLNSIEIR